MTGRVLGVAELLLHRRASTPHLPAYIEGRTGRALTWNDVHVCGCQWAAHRDELSPSDGVRVGLALGDPLAMAAAYLGALGAGLMVAPLDPAAPDDELVRQARLLGLRALVTDGDDARAAAVSAAGVDVWSGTGAGLRTDRRHRGHRPPPTSGVAATILATSGTTGEPKLVPLTERQLLATAAAVVDHHQISPAERGYSPLPLFHVNGLVVGILSTLVAGSSLVVEQHFSRTAFWPTVERHRVTWLNLVPAIIGVLATGDAPSAHVRGRIRFARSAAAPLPLASRARFEARCGIGILETYGMTEAASQICANPLAADERRPGTVGLPVGVELRVVDDVGIPVEAGIDGLVEVRGETIVSRYWGAAGGGRASWPATSPDGWLRTGDVGLLDNGGYLHLVGRIGEVINRGGEKIRPREVEEVILEDARVTAAAVVAEPHPLFGAQPHAFVTATVRADERAALVDDLQKRCAKGLSPFKRPAEITVADILPSGPTGKIRRAELRRRVAEAQT